MEHTSAGRRHLSAVWIADIVGYSQVAAENEDRAIRLVAQFEKVVRQVVAAHGGRTIKFLGDAALAEFPSTEGAALAALKLRASCLPEFELRIGVHVGDVLYTNNSDILGDGVNLAARLQAIADAGQILFSDPAWRQLRHREGYEFVSAGAHELKGQSGALQTWALAAGPEQEGGDGASAKDDARRSVGLSRSWAWLGQRSWTSRSRTALRLSALAGVVALALGIWHGSRPGRTDEPGAANATRLAVLYFDDHSPGQELGYLADGLTEALIHQLAQVDRLQVISRNGVKPFRGGSIGLDSIGTLLGVGSIVEGSVARSGGRVRVTAQLIDAVSGTHLASRVIEEDESELFALQDRVVREVADALRRSLGEEIRLRELRHGTTSEIAYELVLRANALREEYRSIRLDDMESGEHILLRADSFLVEASNHDPGWAEPLIQRGRLKRLLALDAGTPDGVSEPALTEAALGLVNQALELSADAEGFELRGTLRYDLAQSSSGALRLETLRRAEDDLRRALDLDPSNASAWWTLSLLQVEQARFAEAKLSAERALRADAFLEEAAAVVHQIYYTSMQLGPTPDAKAACDEGRRRFPARDEFISCQLFILASFPDVAPDIDRGWRLVDSLIAVVPRSRAPTYRAFGTMVMAQIAARAGMADSARALIKAARSDSVVPLLAYNEAHVMLQLGEPDRAIQLLSIYLNSYPDTALVASDWWFESLRGDPGFQKMVRGGD